MDQNIRLGRSREEALKIMADRVDLTELDSFSSILIQANKMGSSIADTLKAQSERMRAERFLNAEKNRGPGISKAAAPDDGVYLSHYFYRYFRTLCDQTDYAIKVKIKLADSAVLI